MILVSGGTGFIGRALVRQLVESGYTVRILLRPSRRTPRLPVGVNVEVAVSSLDDTRGLRAAMRGVKTVYHLAGGEGEGGRGNLQAVDIDGTANLTAAAADAGVERFYYISHLGADRASAFPVLKAKGIAEDYIRKSGIPYTIMRGSILFGPDDNFTTGLAMLLAGSPGLLLLPEGGKTLLQPLWLEDFVSCLVWSLEEPDMVNQVFEIGGGEYLTLRQIVEIVMEATGRRRLLVPVSNHLMRPLTVVLEAIFQRFPVSVFWLDYLVVNRTCAVDTVPRLFGIMPARFASRLDHLRGVRWGGEYLRMLFTRHG
ncbi:MAG: NAD(P)H-binding protein [Chloroflexota bacterium]